MAVDDYYDPPIPPLIQYADAETFGNPPARMDAVLAGRVYRAPARPTTKETPMSDSTAALTTQLTDLLTKISKAKALEDRFPVEPPNGSILKWTRPRSAAAVRIEGGDNEYTYVALRVGVTWYLTTTRGAKTLIWPELRSRIGNSPAWLVTAWAEIPRAEKPDTDGITDPVEFMARVYGPRDTV